MERRLRFCDLLALGITIRFFFFCSFYFVGVYRIASKLRRVDPVCRDPKITNVRVIDLRFPTSSRRISDRTP